MILHDDSGHKPDNSSRDILYHSSGMFVPRPEYYVTCDGACDKKLANKLLVDE